MSATRALRAPSWRHVRLRWRPGPRIIVALIATFAVLAGGYLWLRDSSLVAIRRVRVTGVSGPDARRIRAALTTAARSMTTLDVQVGQLRSAVAPFPVVKDVQVITRFPHGATIKVSEQLPVGIIEEPSGQRVPVSGDGTVLPDSAARGPLPLIPVRAAPGGARITDPASRSVIGLLAAAPWQLLGRISQAGTAPGHGLMVQIRGGPQLLFGDGGRLKAKWTAALLVLADQGSAGASYIDLSDPARPAAGASGSAGTQSNPQPQLYPGGNSTLRP